MDNQIVVIVKGIISYNNKVLIIKRSDYDKISPGKWEFVGGKIDFGENLEEALIREVMEETQLEIKIEKILYATTSMVNPKKQAVIVVYKCSANEPYVKLSEEHMDYRWVTEEELRELLFEDILKDMDNHNVFSAIFKN